jgi:hypothetical protein
VSTTRTTAAYYAGETAEAKVTEPKRFPVGNRLSVEPLVGFGTNDFNFGAGGRIGYTFEFPMYIGGTFMWHAGETRNATAANGFAETKSNFYYPGVELGYDIGIGRRGDFLVRPYGGAAILFDRERVAVNNIAVSDTSNQFMLYPGLTAHYNVAGGPWYLGVDTRLLVPVDHGGLSYQGFFVTGLST